MHNPLSNPRYSLELRTALADSALALASAQITRDCASAAVSTARRNGSTTAIGCAYATYDAANAALIDAHDTYFYACRALATHVAECEATDTETNADEARATRRVDPML